LEGDSDASSDSGVPGTQKGPETELHLLAIGLNPLHNLLISTHRGGTAGQTGRYPALGEQNCLVFLHSQRDGEGDGDLCKLVDIASFNGGHPLIDAV